MVHEYAMHRESNMPVLVRTNPYIRLVGDAFPPVYLQGGRVYSDAGDEIPPERWAPWVVPSILRLSPTAQQEVGFTEFVQKLNKNLAPGEDPLHRPIPPVAPVVRDKRIEGGQYPFEIAPPPAPLT